MIGKKKLLAVIFLAALVGSLSFLTFLGKTGPAGQLVPGNDYVSFYEPVAENILQGKGISLEGGLDLRYPPGYPIFLSAIFALAKILGVDKLGLIVFFNAILASLSACFLFLIAEIIFTKRIALIASFLWLSYPFNLWFLRNPNSEAPFILLLFMAIWFYLSGFGNNKLIKLFFAGFLFGSAALIRPIGFALPFLLALLLLLLLKGNFLKTRFLLAAVLLAGSILIIMPWEGYVLAKTRRFVLLSESGPTAIIDGLTFAVKPGEEGNRPIVSPDVLALMERAQSQRGNLNSLSKVSYFLAREFINRPIPLIKLIGWKIARSWYATSQMWWEGKILLIQLVYFIFGLFGAVCAFKKYKDRIPDIIFLLSVVLYFWLMTILALSILRYMVPAMGIVMIFSAIAVNLLLNKIWKISQS